MRSLHTPTTGVSRAFRSKSKVFFTHLRQEFQRGKSSFPAKQTSSLKENKNTSHPWAPEMSRPRDPATPTPPNITGPRVNCASRTAGESGHKPRLLHFLWILIFRSSCFSKDVPYRMWSHQLQGAALARRLLETWPEKVSSCSLGKNTFRQSAGMALGSEPWISFAPQQGQLPPPVQTAVLDGGWQKALAGQHCSTPDVPKGPTI